MLGRRAYLALYSQASGPVPPIESGVLRNGSLFLTRPSLGDYTATREELLHRANEVLDWVNSGELKLHIGLTLPLAEAAEAPPPVGRPSDYRQDFVDALTLSRPAPYTRQ